MIADVVVLWNTYPYALLCLNLTRRRPPGLAALPFPHQSAGNALVAPIRGDVMDSLTSQLLYASIQVRRYQRDDDRGRALCWWFFRREELLEQLSTQIKARVSA